ncbi:PucR family transcriptional regulator [Desemzia sp. RIT804]|uniref:PucR family transcriptional regulator n=1 Tax=Desemzia sp. RIT 804 TaxID=2810209 RepID=UPI00194EED84|nr:PucR family transcriptional regulator [Desemzia sp. RIT 804]MBM6615228.1 PucR family transcriptional regulator [Desemzia sp. RIT 804]
MSFTVREMLTINSLSSALLISGKNGLDKDIANIMVMEAPDVEKWLTPGQVLLSSFYSLQNETPENLASFIAKLADYQTSGLIIKKDRFIEKIPRGIVEACEQYDLPLIQISENTPYSTIILEVMQILFNEKVRLLDYYHDIHHKFTRLALEQPSLSDIAYMLAELIHCPISLLDYNKKCLLTTKEHCTDFTVLNSIPVKKESYMNYSYDRQSVRSNSHSDHIFTQLIVKIPNIGNDFHYLVINELDKTLNDLDIMAIENAVSFLQMELIKKFAISEVQQNFRNDIIDDLMTNKFSSKESMYEAASVLNLQPNKKYRIVVTQLIHSIEKPTLNIEETAIDKQQDKRFIKLCQTYWQDLVYRIRSNRIIFIMSANNQTDDEFKQEFEQHFLSILQKMETKLNVYRVGISDETTIDEFHFYSLQALKIIQQVGRFKATSFIMNYQDLGFYRFLYEITDSSKLKELIPSKLLLLYQKEPELVETLHAYLDHNKNLTKSAEALYVHPKTMRYRINKIMKFCELDMDNPEDILSYNIGLRVLPILISQKESSVI